MFSWHLVWMFIHRLYGIDVEPYRGRSQPLSCLVNRYLLCVPVLAAICFNQLIASTSPLRDDGIVLRWPANLLVERESNGYPFVRFTAITDIKPGRL